MTQNEAGERPAASVDEDAVRAFLAGHGPNGPTDDPEMSWAEEIDGWGEPGSADFAHSFESFLYDLQQHGGGLVLSKGIGDGTTMPVLMDVSTDSSGVSDCFLVRVKLAGGAEVTTGTEELHHLASGQREAAVLDALDTVAVMVSDAYRGFLRSMAAFRRNEPAAAEPGRPAPEVVRVWLHQTTGGAAYSTMWNHAGGPAAGATTVRLLEPDRPSPHDGGVWSTHTLADVEAALLARGLRVVTRAEAAKALTEAGYTLGTNRAYGHALYADEADATTWWTGNYNYHAFAIGHVARPDGEDAAVAAAPVGLLACPSCGSTDLASIERGFCRGDVTRDADGEVRVDCGESTDWDGQPSIGVECFTCRWEYLGGDWAAQLVAAQQ